MQKWLPPFDFPLAAVLNPDADATLLFINVNQKNPGVLSRPVFRRIS